MTGVRTGSIVAAIALAMLALPARAGAAEHALILDIDGPIGPPTADYVVSALAAAKPDEVGLVILRMNTPGGLDTSMREIIKRDPRLAGTGRDLCCAERRARRQRRHLYRLRERSRGDGPGHQYRRRDAGPDRRRAAIGAGAEAAKAGTIAAGQRRRAGECHEAARWSMTPSPISAVSPRSTAATPTGPTRPCARPRAFPPPRRWRCT